MRRAKSPSPIDDTARIVISLPRTLLHQLETLADEMGHNRDEVLELALSTYIERQESLSALRNQIAEAYEDYPDSEEVDWQRAMRPRMRAILESEDSANQAG